MNTFALFRPFGESQNETTFEERLEENKYFDEINQYRKKHQYNFSKQIETFPKSDYDKLIQLQKNKFSNNNNNNTNNSLPYFSFPDRKLKSFVELDDIYNNNNNSQISDKRFEKLTQQKFKNVYSIFNLPYQSIQEQNKQFQFERQTTNNKQTFYLGNPSNPYNQNVDIDIGELNWNENNTNTPQPTLNPTPTEFDYHNNPYTSHLVFK
jgi:hypothetical protein